MLSKKNLNPIVTELFIRGRKLNISFVFKQSYFPVLNNVRITSTHYCIVKIRNKRELQQIAFNHSSNFDFKDFSAALRCRSFSKNISKKGTCVMMIRISIIFANQIFLELI